MKPKTLTLLPFHERIVTEMNAIHGTLGGGTARALRAMQEISSTKCPGDKIQSVENAMELMIDRLGGYDNKRFNAGSRVTINRARRALGQQLTEHEAKQTTQGGEADQAEKANSDIIANGAGHHQPQTEMAPASA